MVKTIFVVSVCSFFAFFAGHYMGYAEKVKEGQLRYYATHMADVRGILTALNGEDIEHSPKTVEMLIDRLSYHNQNLHICMVDDSCPGWIKGMVKEVYDQAIQKIEAYRKIKTDKQVQTNPFRD